MVQLVLLMMVYGYGLSRASVLISHGTELLLAIPAYSGLIGSVLLPILSALPDGAFILFSGLGPDAQDQLSVGVGALAGSTVLLVTVTWALSIITGRVNLDDNGKGAYNSEPKLRPHRSWALSAVGVNCGTSVKSAAKWMMGTSLGYCIIQGPAFAMDCGRGTNCARKYEQHWWAFAGVIVCALSFLCYICNQMKRQSADGHVELEQDSVGSPCSDDSDPDPEDKNRLDAPSPALPEAIRTLPEEARVKLLQRSALRSIGLGLVLIVVLTDPMVDALEVFAHRIQIPSFFVAFILAPLASSSLEVIAACRYAAKKTIKTSTISLVSIAGAATMNNTLCLSIFLLLVFIKRLAWEFAAETLAIMCVQLTVGILAQKTTFRLLDAWIILSLYPSCILIVVLLEAMGLN